MDIVERLRIVLNSGRLDDDYAGADLLGEAADEIERLRDKVERLEGALADVLAYYSMPKEKE